MNRCRRVFLLLAVALALLFAGCSAGDRSNGEGGDQAGPVLPAPGDPEYCASILIPEFWGEGVVLEGNPEMGYLMLGFNVPAGTPLHAPFDGLIGEVSLEDYSSGAEDERSEFFEGRSLCVPESLNGFAAYNVTGRSEGAVKSGEIFARVGSDRHIFPKYYGQVNLILEFNLFDLEAADYEELRTLFKQIFERLQENGEGQSR